MEIFIGSDHAGYEMKKNIKEYLQGKDFKVTDLGSFSGEESVDYPDLTREVAEKVLEYPGSFGIMICGTGQGSAMAANRFKKIRAALCDSEFLAEMARAHNHANILCLGARVIKNDLAIKIVDKFLNTKPDKDQRHKRRVEKIDKNVG
ncbi:ribose 5-phosphate isomerase B [Candidatus Peregrinibacteria bacterium]|nr:ribose 5-phosphate isomerase B [Candidatus Peregrinibacteria bacterium]